MSRDNTTTRLRELRGSGYEIATGQPDIRGWDVRDESGRKIGNVHELIFDINALKVRYIVVDVLDVRELELEKRTVLVPIGLAELDQTDDDVILQNVTPFQLRALPRYDRSNLGAKAERDVSQVFGREYTMAGMEQDMDDTFYQHEHFNENNLYRRRTAARPLPANSEELREEIRLRLEIAKAEERAREEASLQRDADLQERVTFNHPEDVRRFENEGRRNNETEDEYLKRRNLDNYR